MNLEGGHQLEVVVNDGHVEAYPVATYVGARPIESNFNVNVDVRAGVGAGIAGALGGGVRVQVNVPPPPSVRVQVGGSVRVH